MKKLFTLFALLTVFLSASAKEITDVEIDFSKYTDISEVPRFSWGGSGSAWDRLSIKDGCLHFHSEEATDPSWDCQFFPIGGVDAEVGVTYTLHFKVKGDHAAGVSMLGFGQTPYGQFQITTDWVEGTVDYECTEANGNILMQCGDWIGDWDIAYLKITHEGKEQKPVEWVEMLTNGDASADWDNPETAYDDQENNYKICVWTKEKGINVNENGGSDPHPAKIEDGVFVCHATTADTDGDASAWDNQIWLESPRAWKTGEQFKLSFRYKASEPVITNTQVHKQNPSDYLHWQAIGDISFTTEWQTYEQIVTVPADANGMWSVAFNLNPNVKTPVDFYIDDLSWQEMKLEHGFFVAASHTDNIPYDFDTAEAFELDEESGLYYARVGVAGDKDSWVNEVMISTVVGNDRQFKANTLKVKGAVLGNEYVENPDDAENWNDYEEGASSKVTLPAAGVWDIYMDTDEKVKQIAFIQVEGEAIKEPVEIVANPTEIIVNAVERDWLVADGNGNAQEDEIGEGQPWDNQLCIMANRPLKAGEVVIIEFDYWADTDATSNTQCGGDAPGAYAFWKAIGDINFTTEPQQFHMEYTVPSDKMETTMQSLTFNLAVMKGANKYHVANFVWCNENKTETLIDMEGTTSFYVKEGAGTAPYEFGTEKPVPDAIKTINVATVKSGKYNDGTKIVIVRNGKSYNVAGVEVK